MMENSMFVNTIYDWSMTESESWYGLVIFTKSMFRLGFIFNSNEGYNYGLDA